MAMPQESSVEVRRGPRGEFVPDVVGRPVWRLLVRGVGVYLPGWEVTPASIRMVDSTVRVGAPGFLRAGSGFGLQLRSRSRGLAPDREIYVRGRQAQTFGMVIAGPAAAIGTRVVDAAELLRYARRLLFEELFNEGDAGSVPSAVGATRAIEGVVFLDRAAGVGLCAEVDPVTRRANCPLLVRFGDRPAGGVQVYLAGGRLAQGVRSQT